MDRRRFSHPHRPGGFRWLDDRPADRRALRHARIDHQQCVGTVALPHQHRRVVHRADLRLGLLGVVVGTDRAHSRDAHDRVLGGDRTSHPAPEFPQRAAER